MATLAEKIAAAKAELTLKADALAAIKGKLESSEDMPGEEDVLKIDELNQQTEKLVEGIKTMEVAEAALARAARPGASDSIIKAPMFAPGGHIQRKPDVKLFVRSAMAVFESYHTHQQIPDILEQHWPGHQDLLEVSRLLTGWRIKGVQAPAATFVPEWAGSLVRETFGAFMDLLRPESVIPQLGLTPMDFNGSAIIKIPMRLDAAVSGQDLGGAFRKEGDPIRVGAARMGTKTLRAYTMGVIGTFTMEMLESSPIAFEDAVQRWMVEDTAKAMDQCFLDGTAEVADTRPAGIANGLAPEDIHASTGNDAANIQADLQAAITGMTNAGLGRRPVWVMNPQRRAAVAGVWNPVGQPAFPSLGSNGTLNGYPVATSVTVPANLVFLIDAAEVVFAGGTPKFSYSTEAPVVEQDGLPRTAGVSAAVGTLDAGVPARSLWQTYSAGLRAVWEVSWARMRAHAVQEITGVAWGTP